MSMGNEQSLAEIRGKYASEEELALRRQRVSDGSHVFDVPLHDHGRNATQSCCAMFSSLPLQ